MKHVLKIKKPYFEVVLSGDKTFEIRDNDRGYQKGDTVILCELDERPLSGFTGREIEAEIPYVTSFNQMQNNVVFGLKNVKLISGI